MFSRTYPFDDITNDFRVILAIQQGKRPAPPSHDLSWVQSWSDEILHLIEACWTKKPLERPSVGHIVEKLHALPNQPVDERQLDMFDTSFSSYIYIYMFHRVIPSICLSPQPRLQRGLVICGCSYGALRIPAVVVPSSQESWSGVRVLVLDSVLDVCSSDFYHVVLCHTACFRLTLGLLHCLSLVSNFVIIHFVFTRNFNKKTRTIQTAFNLEPDVPKDSL
jgi:hypothetical protein